MELSDYIDFSSKRGKIMTVITAVILIAVSGLLFSLIYMIMGTVQTALESTDCVINNNTLVSSCQDLFTMTVYPFLAAKSLLVWGSFFLIFILVIGLLLLGYNSGTKPAMIGVLIPVEILITYGSIHIANIYRTLLDNDVIRNALVPFTVYNKIMLNFPWFVFIISLFALVLGIVNWQKTPVNEDVGEMNY